MREVGRHRKKGRVIRSGRETGMKHKRTERGEARPMTSPLEKRKEKELHLHLGPEGAPWGQPSEMRALWIAVNSFSIQFDETRSIFTLSCVPLYQPEHRAATSSKASWIISSAGQW